MGVAIVGFVFPHSMQSVLEENFTDKIIHTYRDDPDLQNFIDFAQQEVSDIKIPFYLNLMMYFVVQVLWFELRRIY